MAMFKITHKDKKTRARLGVLSTPHGDIQTPSYVIVATHATIKCLKPSDIKRTKTQIVIANTYHLWDEALKIKNAQSVIRYPLISKLGTNLPTMTDSGGFQVFSLGFGKNRIGKILKPVDNRLAKSVIHRQENIQITDAGVYFLTDGNPTSPRLRRARKRFLGPKLSIQLQEKLGADIIFAFDECTSPLDSYTYNKKALERTHKWALKCLQTHEQPRRRTSSLRGRQPTTNNKQMLFGIVQGGRFKSLRVQSAKYIASLPFDGIAIGGSFGKEEMVKTLKWIIPHLPEEKPRHLLGIGKVEDIFNAVEQGIDLFDCVIPTREARHGRIYTKTGHYDIRKHIYKNKKSPLEKGCKCWACKKTSKSKLHSLFKDARPIRPIQQVQGGTSSEPQSNSEPVEPQAQGKRYATIHNVWFFNNLLEKIRESIRSHKYQAFKKAFLKNQNKKAGN